MVERSASSRADSAAAKIAQLQGSHGNPAATPLFIRADFAHATQYVLYTMAVIMAVAGLVALRWLRGGVQGDIEAAGTRSDDPQPAI